MITPHEAPTSCLCEPLTKASFSSSASRESWTTLWSFFHQAKTKVEILYSTLKLKGMILIWTIPVSSTCFGLKCGVIRFRNCEKWRNPGRSQLLKEICGSCYSIMMVTTIPSTPEIRRNSVMVRVLYVPIDWKQWSYLTVSRKVNWVVFTFDNLIPPEGLKLKLGDHPNLWSCLRLW
jgi:hypothetical protein